MENGTPLFALLTTALMTAVVHTLAGPDHYLPFIAIAKSRGYGLKKTLFWTFVCGVGHIASALLIAAGFVLFSQKLSAADFEFVEAHRADIAAYTLIALGTVYFLAAVSHRQAHLTGKAHGHDLPSTQKGGISVWVLFIVFVLGPCEALLPILTASALLGTRAVLLSTVVFSVATIATMMLAVASGVQGTRLFRLEWAEKYAHELAGGTIAACGVAVICGL